VALIVVSGVNLVAPSVGVQVINALLLPIVLGLICLPARRLPRPVSAMRCARDRRNGHFREHFPFSGLSS